MADDFSLYLYNPSKVLPIVFAILTAITASWQIYQSFFKYRFKKLGGIMTWGSAVWIGAFITREVSVYNVKDVNVFIAQFVMILVAPPIYAAAEYFVLGRLLWYLPYHAPLHPGRVVSTFLTLGILVEGLTGSGAGQSAGSGRTDSQIAVGTALIKAALLLQAVIELCFMSIVITVALRCRRSGKFPRNVKIVSAMLVTTSFLVLVRCVFRAVDGFLEHDCANYGGNLQCSPSLYHEWLLWVWEVAAIVLYCYLLNFFHPGKYLPSDEKQYLDPRDGVTERLGPGWKDKRSWMMTVIDPFGLGALIMRTDPVVKFWEEDYPIAPGESMAVRAGAKPSISTVGSKSEDAAAIA